MASVKLIFFVACVVVAAADTKFGLPIRGAPSEPRIINGKDAEKGQFPYQVSLRRTATQRHTCGGSIISDRIIITAGHCTSTVTSPDELFVVLGSLFLNQGGVRMSLDRVIMHEGFHMDKDMAWNDITILRTAEKIKFSDVIQPIALPDHNTPDDGTPAILSGWGRDSTDLPSVLPNHLQYTEIETITLNECKNYYRGKYPGPASEIDETMLCVFKGNIRSCNGDSGGPLVDLTNPDKKALIGIVSWGPDNCEEGYPSVFARVYSHLDWIANKLEELSSE